MFDFHRKSYKHFLSLFVFLISNSVFADAVIVSVASSAKEVVRDLAGEFEHKHPQIKLKINGAGSGTLLRQIERGAPVDIFISADERTMDLAVSKGLVDPTEVRPFVGNQLVAISRLDLENKVESLADLGDVSIQRIAIGNPDSVPAGRYAAEALRAAGLIDQIESKFIKTQNVRQSLDYVARGEVDIAFVYTTDVSVRAKDVKVLFQISTLETIQYQVALIEDSNQKPAARRFVDFFKTADGLNVIRQYGFIEFK